MPTILVVVDDADNRSNGADWFGDPSSAMEAAEDGEAVSEKARQQSVDLGYWTFGCAAWMC